MRALSIYYKINIFKIICHRNISFPYRDPDQIVYVKKVPSSSAENTRTNSIIDSHLLNQKRRKSLKSFRNASLDIGSYLHPDGKLEWSIFLKPFKE